MLVSSQVVAEADNTEADPTAVAAKIQSAIRMTDLLPSLKGPDILLTGGAAGTARATTLTTARCF